MRRIKSQSKPALLFIFRLLCFVESQALKPRGDNSYSFSGYSRSENIWGSSQLVRELNRSACRTDVSTPGIGQVSERASLAP